MFAVGLAAAACGGNAASTNPTPTIGGRLTVFAAASLTESFAELGRAFETAGRADKVTFSFGSSSTLVAQINQGAPVDVFASADTANMSKLTGGGVGAATTPVAFAGNRLAIVVAKDNPRRIASLGDLAKPGVVYITAAPEVPVGRYAQQVLTRAGVVAAPRSLEADVKAIVAKVTLGEADAGIVYATDITAAGNKVMGVAIADDLNIVATYPIAVINGAKHATAATAFVDFVIGADGQAILAKYGFIKP